MDIWWEFWDFCVDFVVGKGIGIGDGLFLFIEFVELILSVFCLCIDDL